jgi:hypothetical protein
VIDLSINEKKLERAIRRARERKILIPTFQEQIEPERIPGKVKNKLKKVGLWDVNPLNLFRITWKNEPQSSGGQFGKVNYFQWNDYPEFWDRIHRQVKEIDGLIENFNRRTGVFENL